MTTCRRPRRHRAGRKNRRRRAKKLVMPVPLKKVECEESTLNSVDPIMFEPIGPHSYVFHRPAASAVAVASSVSVSTVSSKTTTDGSKCTNSRSRTHSNSLPAAITSTVETPARTGSRVAFNVSSLVDYMLCSGHFCDPVSRIEFSTSDLKEIDRLVSLRITSPP